MAGPVPGPRTSDEATTDGTASENGRGASLIGSAVSGFPGSPAIQIAPPSGLTGCSFLNVSISLCCFFHFEQFSPFAHLCAFGMSCSMPTIETDSSGVITSLCFRCRLRELLRRLGSSSDLQSWDLSRLDVCLDGLWSSVHGDIASSIGVAGFGVLGALPRRT